MPSPREQQQRGVAPVAYSTNSPSSENIIASGRKEASMGYSDDLASRSAPAPQVGSTLRRTVVQTLACAQHLVDSRPPGAYQARWCAEALLVGDGTALAMAALANRKD